MKVTAVRPYVCEGDTVEVYDLTVSPYHTYPVGSIFVSNSKRISMLDVNALLSHGAIETLVDAGAIRGQENKDYWMQFMSGYTPTAVKIPTVYEKFLSSLKGAGINVVRDGPRLNVMAMTNGDVKTLAGGRILRSGDTVNFDDMLKPVTGGLFDPALTGGHHGKQWAAIELPEPLPNPVMEEPIRRLLGLTQKGLEAVISGKDELGSYGTGSQAVAKALENINVDREIEYARAQIQGSSAQKRDAAVRRLGYLKAAKKTKIHPKEWMLTHVPVLPPAFRPVSMMGDSNIPLISDPNYLYKELMTANDNYKKMKDAVGDKNVGAERLAIYSAFKAVTGLAEPVHPKLQEKGVSGILKGIFGSAPKYGVVQRKLLSSAVDNVGRAVITTNPDYDMDTIGIPENKAFDIYSKFIVRKLKRGGMPIRDALVHIKNQTPLARKVLIDEMEERPVFANRAPVLHKYGILAFRPKLVKGDTLQVSPLVTKGFNADFDGDAMQFHVPSTPEAVKEAYERMLPSRSLLSPSDFKTPVHSPVEEDYLAGLYLMTQGKPSDKNVRVFRNRADAIKAYERGELSVTDTIQILE